MKLKEYLTASGHVWKDIWFRDNNDELQALFNSLENYILELGFMKFIRLKCIPKRLFWMDRIAFCGIITFGDCLVIS